MRQASTVEITNQRPEHPHTRPVPRKKIRDHVLAMAAKILSEEGYAGLTMERVATASRIAKTTLYRRWPTKASVCMDLYLEAAGRELHDPDTGTLADDLKHIAQSVIRLQRAPWQVPLPSGSSLKRTPTPKLTAHLLNSRSNGVS